MHNQFIRTELLLGKEGVKSLLQCRVAVFGIGGVGGNCAEALARSGVGALDLFDNDTVTLSNINRQIIATHKTIGHYKVDVMKERILDINPKCIVTVHKLFLLPETSSQIDFSVYDYVIDAIDTVSAKIELAVRTNEVNVPMISAMGAGNKLDPTRFVVTDLQKTSMCPLAKVMRHELKKRGIEHLKVVYSTEKPIGHQCDLDDQPPSPDALATPVVNQRRPVPGSVAFVPSVCGLIIAGEVIKDLVKFNHEDHPVTQ
jgi:tRNA A37 threonylcarbamoyladenosine dehydratase